MKGANLPIFFCRILYFQLICVKILASLFPMAMRKAKNFQIERDSLNSYGDENDYREDDEIFDEIDYPQSPNER